MQTSSRDPWWSSLLVLLVASLVCVAYFQELMLQPQLFSPVFGGDGLTIHYNLQYHATYGEGAYLTSQYHPYAESIFMTDGHALLAVVLAALRPSFPGLAEQAPAIANVLVIWSNPLAILLLFLTLRQFGIRWLPALLFGLLIGLMSPQVLRQLGGQYTLGFTWLLPLLLWYIFSWNGGRWYWLKSVMLVVAIYLLGLNNPYLYAISAAFLLALTGLGVLLRLGNRTAVSWAQLLAWGGVFLTSTIALFLTLAYFDTVTDRVEVPYGFFTNVAVWGGLFSSPGVLLYDFIHRAFPGLATPQYETEHYLGLVPLLLAVALPIMWLRKNLRPRLPLSDRPLLGIAFVAGLACMAFGFGWPFLHFEYWSYEHLGAVLQFRAPVRFGWPFYYVIGLLGAWTLHSLWERSGKGSWARPLVLALVVIWAVEGHQYLRSHLRDKIQQNSFHASRLDKFRDIAQAHGIDTTAYSSIFLLPTELGWTDKIHHGGTWRSNHDGYSLSLATGLPLLNGKLSRLSLSRSLLSLQITTHPLVRKDLLDQLDLRKDILLLAAPDNQLDPPERRVRELGTSLYRSDELELLALDPQVLHTEHAAAVAASQRDSSRSEAYHRFAFEDNHPVAFYGQGSRWVGKFWQDILRLPADSLRGADAYDVSFWVYTDGRRFGGPEFYLKVEDAAGARLSEQHQWVNTVYETQNGWQRVDFRLEIPPAAHTVRLIAHHHQFFYLDEVLLRPVGSNVRITGPDGILYNNYRIMPGR